MKKNKKTQGYNIAFFVLAIVLLIAIFAFSKGRDADPKDISESQAILFYSDTCPFCQNVNEYIEDNEVRKHFDFLSLEIGNLNNSRLLDEKALACGIAPNRVGVPFLWVEEDCLIGEPSIVNFFASKIN